MNSTWHKVSGYQVLVDESGRVVRATRLDHNGSAVPAAPYRYDKALRTWINATGVKLQTLKSGISRGRYDIR